MKLGEWKVGYAMNSIRFRAEKTSGGVGVAWVAATALLSSVGCNSLDSNIPESNSQFRLVIPTDVRPALSAPVKPPPITGGTMIVAAQGTTAVASDPERDSVVFVNIGVNAHVVAVVPLEHGDEPGRLVEDDAGRIHVALRAAGVVATLDPVEHRVTDRRAVCAAPRGITLVAPGSLAVACADGKVVFLPAAGGAATAVLQLEPDLRDIVVSGGTLAVSRFKTAELLRLDAQGAVVRRDHPSAVMGQHLLPTTNPNELNSEGQQAPASFHPVVAWRTLSAPNGDVVMVHQRAIDEVINVVPPSMGGSSYGGGQFGCTGVSQDGVTVLGLDGKTLDVTFNGPPLPVNAALLGDGSVAIAHAGLTDETAPRPFVMFVGNPSEGDAPVATPGAAPGVTPTGVSIVSLPIGGAPTIEGEVRPDPGCQSPRSIMLQQQAFTVAVARGPGSRSLVLQTRQPSTIVVIDDYFQGSQRTVSFDDGATLDTGFQLFHSDSGGGIACASCHPEGAEDGNVWTFSDSGARRTQSLESGLAQTAPFHWEGDLPSVNSVMSRVFVGRMGGVNQSPPRLAALRDWLFALRPPRPMRSADDPAVVRGQALFESAACTSCHSGPVLSNNHNADVGKGRSLQVPALLGVAYRAPFMHDGCAKTLFDRFDPACGGGELHGRVAELGDPEIADLVAYLESL